MLRIKSAYFLPKYVHIVPTYKLTASLTDPLWGTTHELCWVIGNRVLRRGGTSKRLGEPSQGIQEGWKIPRGLPGSALILCVVVVPSWEISLG